VSSKAAPTAPAAPAAGSADRPPGAGRFPSWRVAVRIARRDAWRSKGRSLMVLAMIALPITGVSAADITIRSSQLTVDQKVTRDIGAADARLSSGDLGHQALFQSPQGDTASPARHPKGDGQDASADGSEGSVDPRVAMPAGARWISDQSTWAGIRTTSGLLTTEVRELKGGDPMAAGLFDLDRGRFPTAPDEMAATTAFLKSSGLHVGSELRVYGFGRSYRIVGAYDLPNGLSSLQLDALPGSFIADYTATQKSTGSDASGTEALSYLVSVPGDFTWDMVKQANTKGVTVISRQVRLDPPADADVPLYRSGDSPQRYISNPDRKTAVGVAATIVGLAILEICLLAGPAFAVGARRSRRQLGLVGANGGDRRHIRAIVLSGGLVIGAAAAVVGTLLGLVLTLVLRGTLERYVGQRFGGITLRPLELLGIAGLAVLTGVAASVVPAVSASRQSVLTSLTGRRGVRHANRTMPVIGLAAVCLGGGLAVFGSLRTDSTMVVAGGSAIAELGIVALTPTLVGLFGRLGRWLPLAPRLALRDAVRNRGRTAPAVAAVLAAVAGTVAVATYVASADQGDRDSYQALAPRGVVAVTASYNQGRDLAAVQAAVAKRFPVTGRADVSRMVAGRRICDVYVRDAGCGEVQPLVPKAKACPLEGPKGAAGFTLAQRRKLAFDWRCDRGSPMVAIQSDGEVLVGGPAVLHALGIRDGAAEQALARGESVLFSKVYDDHGKLDMQVVSDAAKADADAESASQDDGTAGGKWPVKALPAYFAAEHMPYGVTAVVPRQAAEAAHIRTVPLGSYFTTGQMPSGKQRQALDRDLADRGLQADVYVEQGYTGKNDVVELALMIFAGLVTIGAAGIATGLAQTDAEPDLRTLSAIGAAPRVRRTLSGFQCGVVAAMGVVLGVAAGVVPAIGLRRTQLRSDWRYYHDALDAGYSTGSTDRPHVPIVLPWGMLGLLIVAVPVGAALLAALITRSRVQGRRAEA
jgi:putative ABC transport system permease protein